MKAILYLRLILIGFLAITLPACQSINPDSTPTPVSSPTLAPTETSTPAPTLTPTYTPTFTPTPTITPTPTPLFLVDAGTPLPEILPAISSINAGQVSGLAAWHDAPIQDIAWHPTTNSLAVATESLINLYDPITRQLVRSLIPPVVGLAVIAYDPTGNWLAAGSRQGSPETGFQSDLQLWFGTDLTPVGVLFSSPQGISDISFSPANNLFSAAYSAPLEADNRIDFWNPATWTITGTLKTGISLLGAFSPGGSIYATTPDRYSISVWDLAANGTRVFKLPTSFTGAVNALAYAPSGLTLATGHYDGRIILWDLFTGTQMVSMQTDGVVESLAFSPDGTVLASGSGFADQAIRLWNPATGELMNTLPGHLAGVNNLAFSPNGQYLASGSYDGDLRLWGIRP